MNAAFYRLLFILVLIEMGIILFYTQTNKVLSYIQQTAPHPSPATSAQISESIPPSMAPSSNQAVLSEQTTQTSQPQSTNNPDLDSKINKALDGTTGKYAIVVKNLKTGESYQKNENLEFEPGSLYKLWVMATTYQQIESEEINLDETMSQSIPTLNRKFGIAEEDAELKTGGITLTVKNALNQMITISHNYAALLLVEKLKLSTVSKFLTDKGFSKSKVGTDGSAPISTAADIAKFLELLYNGKLANPEHTDEMIKLLKAQELNNKLPVYLPKNTVIAHKTGEIGMFTHDAGIVYTQKGDYIIVVMSESEIPKAAEDRIANISKEVFSYFSTK